MSSSEPAEVQVLATDETVLAPVSNLANSLSGPVPLPRDDKDPETIEGYEVRGKLGSGANGKVYLAYDAKLDREVAIKVLGRSEDPDSEERLRREGRAIAALRHPNIIEVYASGDFDGRPYIVMERLDHDLRLELEQLGPMDYETGCENFEQAILGLAAALEGGYLHRDIKPANFMRDKKRKRLVIADFGLARGDSAESSLTATGTLLGTPYYVAPEIIETGHCSVLTDIYSLGASFYHLFAGRPPFERPTAAATLLAHVKDQARPLQSLREDLPEDLCRLVMRCLSRDPARRPQSYAELLSDLRAIRAGSPLPPDELALKVRRKLKIESTPRADSRITATPRASSESRARPPRAAPRWARALAWLIDMLSFTLTGAFGALTLMALELPQLSEDAGVLLGVGAALSLWVALSAWVSRSPGQVLLGLRFDGQDGEPPDRLQRILNGALSLAAASPLALLIVLGHSGPASENSIMTLFTIALLILAAQAVRFVFADESESLSGWLSRTRLVVDDNPAPSLAAAALLWLPPLGILGAHRFYLRRRWSALLWLMTSGLFGIGWLMDLVLLPFLVFKRRDQLAERVRARLRQAGEAQAPELES